jgi:hypothetical protein
MFNHMRNRPDTIFFKKRNPVFERENNPPPAPPIPVPLPAPKIEKQNDEDGNDCEYMKALTKKYEPRKNSNIQNAYMRMYAILDVRKSLMQIEPDELIEMCILSPSSFDFAMLLYKFCGTQFRCIDILNQKWEISNNRIWTADENCVTNIRGIITSHMCDFFKNKLNSIRALNQNTYISGEFTNVIDLKIKNIEYILNRLVTLVMQNQIIKDASELFFYSCVLENNDVNG